MSWFVGAWRRRSITVPGGEPTEPCEAWWVQTERWFVDVRVALPGHEDNALPFSQTRVFAGWFEIADGEARWHLLLDSAGLAPRTDRAAAGGLWIEPDDPAVMIEDASGRFREVWVRPEIEPETVVERCDADAIVVRVGAIRAEARRDGDGVISGRLVDLAERFGP